VQNRAAAVKLLAERRAGQLLAGSPIRAGRRSQLLRDATILPKEISRIQSHRWQAIARSLTRTFCGARFNTQKLRKS
jgi:hypothetical protein